MSDQQKDRMIQDKASKPGKRSKIDAKCIECVYDPREPGTWRKQVENCTCSSCPLYEIRARPLASDA